MTGKVATPGMPDEGQRKGPRDADGQTDGLIPRDERGAGGGGPVGPKGENEKDFHGGQSNAAYHGHGQLGDEDVEGQCNANAPSEDP